MNDPPLQITASLLTRKDLLAITAVLDIALHARGRPLSAAALASRHELSPRHLEPVLQELVRHGILRSVRGPRGGYELARERRRINAAAIVQAARAEETRDATPAAGAALLRDIVAPAVAEAQCSFAAALAGITLDDLVERAAAHRAVQPDQLDFTI
jgi:Rrf2 family protein